ncbi:flavoprotein [Spinellus fusiger]|nr:flavoprotein [Spinellus fusiger]
MNKKYNILIGTTGSVASIKVPELVDILNKNPNVDVRVLPTKASLFFLKDKQVNAKMYNDEEDWETWKVKSDPVLHIDLRNWADIMLIAPLDANTLAKIANGLCDNLLTCVVRAWDMSKPTIVCPAMNTHMWNHPFTEKHLRILGDVLGFRIISPISKLLACGDQGIGAMEEPHNIASTLFGLLEERESRQRDAINPV